jgi:hypothetical protein
LAASFTLHATRQKEIPKVSVCQVERAAYGLTLCMEFTIKKINEPLEKVLFFLVVIQTTISIFWSCYIFTHKQNLK